MKDELRNLMRRHFSVNPRDNFSSTNSESLLRFHSRAFARVLNAQCRAEPAPINPARPHCHRPARTFLQPSANASECSQRSESMRESRVATDTIARIVPRRRITRLRLAFMPAAILRRLRPASWVPYVIASSRACSALCRSLTR